MSTPLSAAHKRIPWLLVPTPPPQPQVEKSIKILTKGELGTPRVTEGLTRACSPGRRPAVFWLPHRDVDLTSGPFPSRSFLFSFPEFMFMSLRSFSRGWLDMREEFRNLSYTTHPRSQPPSAELYRRDAIRTLMTR
ncbi:hypothetical protein J6590_026101 [Homalodisca vitripennis]|nr:hypothetical protein J6590_026101 [Homalodisca vitripennis]